MYILKRKKHIEIKNIFSPKESGKAQIQKGTEAVKNIVSIM